MGQELSSAPRPRGSPGQPAPQPPEGAVGTAAAPGGGACPSRSRGRGSRAIANPEDARGQPGVCAGRVRQCRPWR